MSSRVAWDDALLSKLAHDVRGPAGVAASALVELERTVGDGAGSRFSSIARRSLRRLLLLADRLSTLAALDRTGDFEVTNGVDLLPLATQVAVSAGEVYARRAIPVTVHGSSLRVAACVPWISAAIADALMLCCGVAENVRIELGGTDAEPEVRVRASGSAELLSQVWARGVEEEERSAFPAVRLIQGVMRRHHGSARVEDSPEGAAIALTWQSAALRG